MFFKWRVVAIWAFFAVYQSLVFFYFVTVSSSTSQGSSGKMFGLWDVSTMAFTCVVVTVNLRLLMICSSITRWHYISVGGSILAWFLFIFIYSGIMTPYDRQVSHESCFVIFLSNGGMQLLDSIATAGECLLGHICLDEYILFLHHSSPCSCCCTFGRFPLPRVRMRNNWKFSSALIYLMHGKACSFLLTLEGLLGGQ